MDDTTQSRISEAAATRKRRSSILKSQRPPRTPFCELEFNVCTPTDTNKSRRVSFSRKTGVAEFVANEATTTWTNLYEQLSNKSQESSGNDLEVNHTKQRISHLGTRIFDQQFEDVEFELMGPGPGVNTSTTIGLFPQQIEHADSKLLPPQNNFELSAFTEQSKLFADDLAVTCPGETFDNIDINISAAQRAEENDDLNEIQKDLMRQSNVVCHGPFNGRQNLSEYIEVDLNTTHAAMKNDESDMSITDTIHSPKVQDISKSISIEKKVKVDEDWVADKENIVMNPYIAPRESINFAVNDGPDKVLVFDGKRLIVETEQRKTENYRQTLIPNMPENVSQRKTLVLNCNDDLPNFIENTQVSNNASGFLRGSEFKQSMVLNDTSLTEPKSDESQNKLRTIHFNDDLGNISVTNVVPNIIHHPLQTEMLRTIVYENKTGNISITQPVPSKIIDIDKRKTIIYDNSNSANVSTTQAVPANLVLCNENNEKLKPVFCEKEICNISLADVPLASSVPENTSSKRRTIVFDDVAGNVSLTQAIPSVLKDSVDGRRTVLFEDKTGNISVTQARTSHKSFQDNAILPDRVRTVVFERDTGHISVMQALPSKIILPHRLNATYEDNVNISVTQIVPTNILLGEKSEPDRRRTVVYKDDTGNLSITQAVPLNQVIHGLAHKNSKNAPSDIEISTNKVIHNKNNEEANANKGKTVVFESDDEDISMTQAVNLNGILPSVINKLEENISNMLSKETEINKSQTIVFQNDDADISITRAVPINQIIAIVNEHDQKDTDNVAVTNIALHKKEETSKRRTIVFENEDADISMTQAVPTNQVINILNEQKQKKTDSIEATNLALHAGGAITKRRTIVFENEDADVSMTQAVPMNQVINILYEQKQTETDSIEATNLALHAGVSMNKRRTIVFENEDADISMTQAVPMNQVIDILNEQKQKETDSIAATNLALHAGGGINKRRTIVFENEDADISMTQAVPMNQVINILNERKQKETDSIEATNLAGGAINKRKTIVFENEDADISFTQMVNFSQALLEQREGEKRNVTENDLEEVTCAALHLRDEPNTENRRRTIMYDDDPGDNISITQSIPSKIAKGEQIKSKAIIFDDVSTMLKNNFMEVLTEGSEDNEDMETLDVSMADVRDTDGSSKIIAYENDTDMSITKAVLENLSPKVLQDGALDETANKTISKYMPAEYSSFQYDVLEKSYSEPVIEHDDMLVKATNIAIISNVVVYQAVTEKQHTAKTETGNLDESIADEKEDYMDSSETANKNKISSSLKTNKQTYENDNEQAELKSVCLSAVNVQEPKGSGVSIKKSSMLNDLLDMTQTLSEGGIDDKGLMANINNEHSSASLLAAVDHETDSMDAKTSMVSKRSVDAKSSVETKGHLDGKDSTDTKQSTDTLFFITKDSEERVNSDKSDNTNREMSLREKPKLCGKSQLSIEFADEKEPVKEIHKKLSSIKSLLRGAHSSKIKNHLLEESVDKGNKSLEGSTQNLTTKSPKTFKMANDTKELLDMISDITEKPPLKNLSPHLEEEQEISEPILENQKETFDPEPIKLSYVPKRQSVAPSREEILKNMSMASATLQKSRFELDESDTYDDEDTVNETASPALHKKSLRLSKEVVKTLHFEGDDSLGETEQDQSNHATPLKKTAFGEISYMKETKSKVIPTYLNVSNGIKELMDDLVKPMADVLPFETSLVDKGVRRTPSTCSIQIQANLLTSSQIDLHTELESTTESTCQFNKHSSDDIVIEAVNRSISRALEAPIKTTPVFDHSENMDVVNEDVEIKLVKHNPAQNSHSKPHEQPVGKVLIFDHDNPLNNVFLAPPVAMEVHSYNPVQLEEKQSEKTLKTACPTVIDATENFIELDSVTTQFCIENRRTTRARSPEIVKVSTETQSQCSNISKSMLDQFTEPKSSDVKDTEVNTVIVMRGNKELLDASSSLTLVDDTLVRSAVNLKMDSTNMPQGEENADSHLEVIYKLEPEPQNLDSDLISNYETGNSVKPKKRLYSPTKRDRQGHRAPSSLETSPTPLHKMQKRSLSPDHSEQSIKQIVKRNHSPKRDIETDTNETLKSPRVKRPGTTITVQQLMTMVHVEEDNQSNWQSETDTIKEESPEELGNNTDSSVEPRSPALCEVQELASSEIVTSFTSSKNLKDDRSSLASPGLSRMPSRNLSRLDWVPESDSDGVLKSQAAEIESATSVITRIDMMPFMGSHDCEWDSSAGDTWSFFLLHARLRLAVQFQREPRLAPDTPVVNVGLETMHHDKKNPIATLCVKYAAEVMRFYISRGCGTAADVPKLVRRLAAAARLAARWARAMHDARARLAYTLTPDGWLELKVANTSLRLVWEVTLQLELVVEDARSVPWPCACGVRVARVLPAGPAPPAAVVARVLRDTPRDWGHAPRTLWKIFRYLKYRKRDDDILLQA